jgi:hypothetical protein
MSFLLVYDDDRLNVSIICFIVAVLSFDVRMICCVLFFVVSFLFCFDVC